LPSFWFGTLIAVDNSRINKQSQTKGDTTMLVRFDYPRTYNNLVEDLFAADILPTSPTYPAVDVAQQENETVVIAELPGVKKEDVKITFENNLLTISGERKPYEIPYNARVLLNEVRVRDFSRSIEIAHDVDVDKISAEMNNGVLRVALPKAESARVRTIELK
jgi:HSP20 family protein